MTATLLMPPTTAATPQPARGGFEDTSAPRSGDAPSFSDVLSDKIADVSDPDAPRLKSGKDEPDYAQEASVLSSVLLRLTATPLADTSDASPDGDAAAAIPALGKTVRDAPVFDPRLTASISPDTPLPDLAPPDAATDATPTDMPLPTDALPIATPPAEMPADALPPELPPPGAAISTETPPETDASDVSGNARDPLAAARDASILEGTKDIGSPSTVLPPQDAAESIMARMPRARTLGASDKADSAPVKSGRVTETDEPCPLENESDPAAPPEALKRVEAGSGAEISDKSEDAPDYDALAPHLPADVLTERFQAAQEFGRAPDAQAQPVSPAGLFDEMLERVEYLRGTDTQEMNIQLKPEYLGKVSLKLTLGENGMQVKISAGNSDVKNLINSQVSALSETLTNRGIQIDSIDVVYTGVDNSDLTHSRGQQEAPREQTRRRYAAPVGGLAELGFADISWAAQMLDLEVSSVEYSA